MTIDWDKPIQIRNIYDINGPNVWKDAKVLGRGRFSTTKEENVLVRLDHENGQSSLFMFELEPTKLVFNYTVRNTPEVFTGYYTYLGYVTEEPSMPHVKIVWDTYSGEPVLAEVVKK